MLSTKKGKDAWVEPVIEAGGYRFMVKTGAPEAKPDPDASEAGGAEIGVSEAGVPEASVSRNGALESGIGEPEAGRRTILRRFVEDFTDKRLPPYLQVERRNENVHWQVQAPDHLPRRHVPSNRHQPDVLPLPPQPSRGSA